MTKLLKKSVWRMIFAKFHPKNSQKSTHRANLSTSFHAVNVNFVLSKN